MMRLWAKRGWWVGVHWEPRDLWIGLYWTCTRGQGPTMDEPGRQGDHAWHGYLCLVPCVPLHVVIPCHGRTTHAYAAEEPGKERP